MSAGIGDTDEVCRMAIALARSAGYAVFPVGENKRPTRPSEEGVLHGFHDATTDPAEIAWLWANWPGPLIGVATGEKSDLDVLDADRKHGEALAWWKANHHRLLPTRTFVTRSGGLHLYFRHRDGIRNTQGKLCPGIDTRGSGGYAIYWFAVGFDCLDHTPPQPFPDWLYRKLTYQPPAPTMPVHRPANPSHVIDGILRTLAEAREGERNGMVFWCACRLAEHGIGQREIEALLAPIAQSIGLTDIRETRATIRSAMGRKSA
jgi:hypothetical protein